MGQVVQFPRPAPPAEAPYRVAIVIEIAEHLLNLPPADPCGFLCPVADRWPDASRDEVRAALNLAESRRTARIEIGGAA